MGVEGIWLSMSLPIGWMLPAISSAFCHHFGCGGPLASKSCSRCAAGPSFTGGVAELAPGCMGAAFAPEKSRSPPGCNSLGWGKVLGVDTPTAGIAFAGGLMGGIAESGGAPGCGGWMAGILGWAFAPEKSRAGEDAAFASERSWGAGPGIGGNAGPTG